MIKKIKKIFPSLNFTVFLFFICCLAGWIYEVVLGFYQGKGFVNRGFLYGPYLPVYGFGGLLGVLLFAKFSKKQPLGKIGTPFLILFLFGLLSAAVELFTGNILEHFLNMRMWDYSTHWLHYKGLISPFASFRFALGGLMLLYCAYPLINHFCETGNKKIQKYMAICICCIMFIDFVATLIFRYTLI